jgi:hypothetical protein
LRDGVLGNSVGELGEERVEQLGLSESHRLDHFVHRGRAALDKVGGKSPRGADKAKKSGARATDLVAESAEAIMHEGEAVKVDGVKSI